MVQVGGRDFTLDEAKEVSGVKMHRDEDWGVLQQASAVGQDVGGNP